MNRVKKGYCVHIRRSGDTCSEPFIVYGVGPKEAVEEAKKKYNAQLSIITHPPFNPLATFSPMVFQV